MKITPRILSLPPYISTSWQNIVALHAREEEGVLLLVVDLMNGNRIEIPHLDPVAMEQIFTMHAAFHEGEFEKPIPSKSDLSSLLTLHLPAKFLGEGIEKITGVLQHNPEAADTADLPQEILDKVATIVQSLPLKDPANLPSPVDDCNCMFCQIARTVQAQFNSQAQQLMAADEEVSPEDLNFKSWEIKQKDDQLYEVINPLDALERYNVFLGNPVGCTCGGAHCEHIQAVLRS